MASDMRLEGYEQTLRKFNQIDLSFGKGGEKLLPVLMRAGKIMRSHIRVQAPLGPTGNLRRMVGVTKVRHTAHNRPGVRVHSFAPHSHLINNGHITRSGSHVPPNPYFDRGVVSATGVVKILLEREIAKRVDRAAR